jgi:hypothetical protein
MPIMMRWMHFESMYAGPTIPKATQLLPTTRFLPCYTRRQSRGGENNKWNIENSYRWSQKQPFSWESHCSAIIVPANQYWPWMFYVSLSLAGARKHFHIPRMGWCTLVDRSLKTCHWSGNYRSSLSSPFQWHQISVGPCGYTRFER